MLSVSEGIMRIILRSLRNKSYLEEPCWEDRGALGIDFIDPGADKEYTSNRDENDSLWILPYSKI